MRLYLLAGVYSKQGRVEDLRKIEDALRFADFRAYGLRDLLPVVIEELAQRSIWSLEMKRRAQLGFLWDQQASLAAARSGEVDPPLKDSCLATSAEKSPPDNVLAPLDEWLSITYASQAGLVADSSYRFRTECDAATHCSAGVLGLWQRAPAGDLQPARAGFMSPELALPAGLYRFTLSYCTALRDEPDSPAVQVYVERSQAFPLDLRLPGTGGQWREYSAQVVITEDESRAAPRFWLASYGNGLTVFAQPSLTNTVQLIPVLRECIRENPVSCAIRLSRFFFAIRREASCWHSRDAKDEFDR